MHDSFALRVAGRGASAALALVCLGALTASAHAAGYPDRPVRLIVATSPGGGTDAIARIFAARLAASLGEPFVVDNRAGGSGIVGTEIVARAPADGHTLLMGFIASLAIVPALTRTPYDPLKDLAPVSLVAAAQYVLTVHPSVPARTLKEFVAYAKANPGKLNYASAGNGTPVHMAAELFKLAAGVDMVHVPYKGGGPAAAAVLAGESQVIFGSVAATLPHVKAGRLVALAVTGAHRARAAPEFPTIAELGYPGFEVTSWYGFVAPAGTPRETIARLNAAILEALRSPDVAAQMARQGLEPIGSTPAEFAAHLRRENEKWRRVVKEARIKPG